MPELPEVETVRRGLEHLIVGKKIVSVEVRVPKMVKTGVEDFQLDILGQTFESIGRRGKYLLLNFNKQTIISHLRMEGKYLLFEDEVPDNKHFHLFFGLDGGSTLVYQDVRKFGTFELLPKSQVEAYFVQKKLVLSQMPKILNSSLLKKDWPNHTRSSKHYFWISIWWLDLAIFMWTKCSGQQKSIQNG